VKQMVIELLTIREALERRRLILVNDDDGGRSDTYFNSAWKHGHYSSTDVP
jgi:hypothetical protein